MSYLLQNEIIGRIYDYDDTYKLYFNDVLEEYNNLLLKYDDRFYKYHTINSNIWKKDKNITKWIKNYGIIYDPIKWILKLNKVKN